MNYLEFKKNMIDLSCFHINQILTWQVDFDRNNLTRWINKGLLIRLKQGYYTFPEYKNTPGFSHYIANKIYNPSYVSLHTALSFYGMIPEAVIQITSVTSLKTAVYKNEFGEFTYKTIKKELMFGYDLKKQSDGRTIKIANPEKALLDLFYLYSFYDSVEEMQALRFDDDFLHCELNLERMRMYLEKIKSKALERRTGYFFTGYEL